MRYVLYGLRILLLVTGIAALCVGVVYGEWRETMSNAILL
jgi:hypothetical protein